MKKDINLLYKRKTTTYSSKKLAGTLIVLLLFAGGLYAGIALPSASLAAVKIQSGELDSRIEASSVNQQELTEKTQQKQTVSLQFEELQALDEARSDITDYIDAIERSCPTEVNISYLSFAEFADNILNIKGDSPDDSYLAVFCIRLNEQGIFQNVYLMSSVTVEDTVSFNINVVLPSTLSSIELVDNIEHVDEVNAANAAAKEASK